MKCKKWTSNTYFQSNSCEKIQNTIEQTETNKKVVETILIHIEARLTELYKAKFASIIKTVGSHLMSTVRYLEVRV